MAFEENRILFGHDPETRLLAVEQLSATTVELFRRGEDGALQRREEPLRPFLWVSEPIDLPGVSYERLKGAEALQFLAECSDWDAFSSARNAFRAAGIAHFAPSEPALQYLLRSGKTLFKQLPAVRRLQIWIPPYDGVGDATEQPVRTVRLADSDGWSLTLENENERALLEAVTAAIRERDPDVIEGHDLFRGILHCLAARARRVRLKLAWGRDGSPLRSRSSRLQIAEKAFAYPKFVTYGRHFVDTFVLAQFWDVSARELEGFTLEEVAEHFHLGAEPGGPTGQTAALSTLLGGSHFIQAQFFPYNFQDVVLRGNATKINTLFLREYLRQGHSIPVPPETRAFEGGYTDIFITGVLRNVWHCDVASLYPSVMLRFDCFPAGDKLGIFRELLQDLRQFRLEAKAALRGATDPGEVHHLQALQAAFKILINSFYGYLGFAQGHFADFDAASRVTQTGRELLRAMVDWLREEGAKVIEIDTDGIYFTPPEGATQESLQAGLGAVLPDGIEVDFDASYAAMFSYKAKNYALLTHEGEVILRGGALRSRGMERYLRLFLAGMLRHFLQGEPEKVEALRLEFEQSIRNYEWPIEHLMKCDSLQEALAQYSRKIEAGARNRSAAYELALQSGLPFQAGDQVRYYITGTKARVAAYENARLVTDWDAAARDENVEYYAAKLKELAKRFHGTWEIR